MQGRAKDVARVRELLAQEEEWLRKYRPDLLGTFVVWQDDGSFTQVAYFTSEAEARLGERSMESDLPEEARSQLEEWRSLVDDLTYVDLKEPWLVGG
jgi:hypothetical protein